MKNSIKLFFLLGLLFMMGCSTDEDLVITNEAPRRDIFSREFISTGVENAVKKAYQMTDILFVPQNPIEYNTGTYQPGITYKGLIYSSVKETETYVGESISFHTFITAVNNPRSKLYTERMDQYPYHGVNCRAYYGTVCNGLVSYALGLVPRLETFDFPESDLMDMVDYTYPENLQVADVLWKEGHVALITDIISDENNQVTTIEISESSGYNCKRYCVSREHFLNVIMFQNFERVYRYIDIYNNSSFTPIPEIDVENGDNLAVCVDKGDKSCYLEGEDVIINILTEGCDGLEIYKDGELFLTNTQLLDDDVVLKNLTYGDYMARMIHNNETTGITSPTITRGTDMSNCETYWKVVNTEVDFDVNYNTLYFKSSNAKPLYVICCKDNGSRPHLKSGFYHVFTDDEIYSGKIEVNKEEMYESYPYMKIFFETDYGLIINKPIKWCE